MSAALNPLVEKIRAMHPGAYDDMDDATLTKAVLAKYPQYSDLAAPPASAAPGAPPKTLDSGEGPIAQGMTTMERKFADMPGQLASAITSGIDHPRSMRQVAEDQTPISSRLKALNPIARDEGSLPMNIGATAANFLPLAIDPAGGGIAESPIARSVGAVTGLAKDALPSAARAGAALQEVKSVAGSVPIDTAKAGNSALELYTQSQRGATLPPAVNKLVRRMVQPDSPPLTYEEAKDFQSNISNLSANEKMNLKPNQVRLLGQLNSDLKSSLADAADTVGKGQQFTDAMREYHQAMKLKGYSDAAIDAAWKAAIGASGAYTAAKIFGLANAPGH
jgi:hypothetical protein